MIKSECGATYGVAGLCTLKYALSRCAAVVIRFSLKLTFLFRITRNEGRKKNITCTATEKCFRIRQVSTSERAGLVLFVERQDKNRCV